MPHLKFMDMPVHHFKHLLLLVVYPFLQIRFLSPTPACSSPVAYTETTDKNTFDRPPPVYFRIFPHSSRLANNFTRTSVMKTFRHRQTFCAGWYTPEGIRHRQGVGSVHPLHFFLLPRYRLSSCHLFFFLNHFHIHVYNLLRPYRIIEFYYMLRWIYSALEIPPS